MARNRKAKTSTASTETPKDPPKPLIELSEEEQWRLINQTGVLKEAAAQDEPLEEPTPLAEEIFNAVLLIVPFSFLLMMMEILIHFQYGRKPTFGDIADRMVSGVPILSIFIFYTTRYKDRRRMQFLLSLISIASGMRLIYMINRSSWRDNMRQCPPLATMWVYTVVQLDLGPAFGSLSIVGAWVWWKGLKLIY
ncbi:hypothetical protein PLICRDRAFT_33590 [Plicaturopsis crispa FD-325 SS-3]|nr:hypothetical protein PLICRDRAFT_33590 [Plicaturopsis crispa FD-325 SS-3]